MSKLKTSSTSSEPALHAEKEFQLARQQAEMKAGEALFRNASQKIVERREKLLSDDADVSPIEENQPRDTAQLSELHRRPRTGEAGSADEVLEWVLEMAEKDWEAFLKWQPEFSTSLQAQLSELSKLYLALLEAALKYAEGENLVWQMERLDVLLAQKLCIIMEQNLEQLTILLEQNGQTAVMDGIFSSLYRQTAGRTLSLQGARSLFAQGGTVSYGSRAFSSAGLSSSSLTQASPDFSPSSLSKAAAGSFSGKAANTSLSAGQDALSRQSGRRQQSASSSSFSGEGMIYQSSRKQNVRFQQVYHGQKNSWREQIKQRNEVIGSARKGIADNTFHKAGTVVCSGKDLEAANRFAAHLNGRGNLFQNPEISAVNDEVTGLLAAIMSMKGQVYAGECKQADSLVLGLQKAIRKMVDHYLAQKGAANVYYHTLEVYQRGRNPQKAIMLGQDYAYQRFCKKQKEPAYQRSAPYSREAGFFRAVLKNISPEKEVALGVNVLQKDWENFLRSLGKGKKSSHTSKAERYSPWGILLDPGMRDAEGYGGSMKILLGAAVLLLIAIVVFVLL